MHGRTRPLYRTSILEGRIDRGDTEPLRCEISNLVVSGGDAGEKFERRYRKPNFSAADFG